MRKILLIIAALFLMSSGVNAQLWKLRLYELSGGIGTTQIYGDIGGFTPGKNILGLKDFTFLQTRLNLNTNLRYRIRERVSARLSLTVGSFHSTDIRGSNETRGFKSRTLFFEPALMGEYYFIKNKGENSFLLIKGTGKALQSFFELLDLYAFGGFGGIAYNVTPNDVLAPRATKTSGFTPVIPFGIGASLVYSSQFSFGVELGARYTFTDNLDGYTSIYSKYNDVYHFFNLTFTYKIKTGDNMSPSF